MIANCVLLLPLISIADTTGSYNFQIPFVDARGEPSTFVRFRAADVSTTGITLVVYGGDNKIWSAAEKAISDARKKDIPAGIVIADGKPSFDVFIAGVQIVPAEGEPVAIPDEHQTKSYYYRAAMSAALEAYKNHSKEAERRKK